MSRSGVDDTPPKFYIADFESKLRIWDEGREGKRFPAKELRNLLIRVVSQVGHSKQQQLLFGSNNLITGGTFIQQNQQYSIGNVHVQGEGGFEILKRAVAPSAFHDSGERFDPPRCHPNTRTAVLEKIVEWAMGKGASAEMAKAFVMWLYGPAGAGKSAIAQTISELCKEGGSLLASFFFSRTDPARNHARSLVSSIIYQTIQRLPQAKKSIVDLIERDPLIFTRSLDTQFTTLLFEPLRSLVECGEVQHLPLLIVIDGLDECAEPAVQANILEVLCTEYRQRYQPLNIRFLIASRPELHITFAFSSRFTDLTGLALDNTYHPNRDINLFLQDKFADISRTHLYRRTILPGWPGQDIIDNLVDKSSGQFIYASTPTKRLEVVLGLRPALQHMPFAQLDALYSHLLSSVDDVGIILNILGLVILGIDTTTTTLEAILGLESGDIPVLLGDLASLIFHASLKDFLFDHSRSKEMHIDPILRHAQYAHLGFQCLGNIEKGWSFATTRDILRSILYHLKFASLTTQLHNDIMTFDPHRLRALFDSQGWSDVPDVSNFWCSLLKLLDSLTWDNATELHALQLKKFDQFLIANLAGYYSEPFLTFVVTMIFVNPKKKTIIPQARKEITNFDQSRLRILPQVYTGGKSLFEGPYLVMLREFLSDTTRCEADMVVQARCLSVLEEAAKADRGILADFLSDFQVELDDFGKLHHWLNWAVGRRPSSISYVSILDFRYHGGDDELEVVMEQRMMQLDATTNWKERT
ncbi:hypothetical protein CPB84DRAFT_1827978 [Gymnopilus junonius]|uniref:NACHT domain-containing protein n=1 Tax=Gymnopilus junonius TaxID=109634 RepID=A0A9P5NGC5_GYMJU|nr:hypothetical protein CPB84DRAFT_1827978 [Gymnopilus junonius]